MESHMAYVCTLLSLTFLTQHNELKFIHKERKCIFIEVSETSSEGTKEAIFRKQILNKEIFFTTSVGKTHIAGVWRIHF